MAAFTASIVACSSSEMCSDMWNLYSGTHPDLHDNFMDPPERIMVHPPHKKTRHASCKEKDCFDVYYGNQSNTQNPYTTSAVMEVEKCFTFAVQKAKTCVVNTHTKLPVCKTVPSQQGSTDKGRGFRAQVLPKQFLAVPSCPKTSLSVDCIDLRRNKSDSDISSLDDCDAVPVTRARVLSDSSSRADKCVCECTCGHRVKDGTNVAMATDRKHCAKDHKKTRHTSRSFKRFLHDILS